jgi:hypothetical protein
MPTKTNPKKWARESRIIEDVPPAHLSPNRRPKFIITKKERLGIVDKHFPNLSKTEKAKAAEGIEAAVRKFLLAANIDDRPLPANIRARMKSLEKTASDLLQELKDCDDLSWEVITRKADITPPPSPKPRKEKGKSKLSNDLYVPLEIGPMDPPDRLIEQLEQYLVMFSGIAKNAGTMANNRKHTAFSTLVGELNSIWNTAMGLSGKGNPDFTDFVETVAKTDPVFEIARPVGDQRRKIQRAIIKVSS